MANFHQVGGRTTAPPPTLPPLDVNAGHDVLVMEGLRHNVSTNPFAGLIQNAPHARENRTVTQLDPHQLNAMSDWDLDNIDDTEINALSNDDVSKLSAHVIERIMSPGSVWQISTDANAGQCQPVYMGKYQHDMDDLAATRLIEARVFNKLSAETLSQISGDSLANLSKEELDNIEPKVLGHISDGVLKEIHPNLTVYLNNDAIEAAITRVENSPAPLGFSDKTKP